MRNKVEFSHIYKNFSNKKVLIDLSFGINEGEVFSIVGPNGAGKTTTFKILTGLLKQDSGSIYIDGVSYNPHDLKLKKKMFFIPDNPFLYEKLTGRECLDFIFSMYKREITEYDEKVNFFDIRNFLDTLIEGYSHGYRKRLLLSAMYMLEPEISVLDEPLVGLDPFAIIKLREMINIFRKKKKTILLSLHTLDFAEKVSDRIGIINDGSIIAIGTLKELRQKAGQVDTLEDIFMRLV